MNNEQKFLEELGVAIFCACDNNDLGAMYACLGKVRARLESQTGATPDWRALCAEQEGNDNA